METPATPDGPAGAGTFRPLGAGTARLHGPPALLVCGLTPEELARWRTALRATGVAHGPVYAVAAAAATRTLAELTAAGGAPDSADSAGLPRAVILSGLREQEVPAVMAAYRACGLPRPLWAAHTPMNTAWPLAALLAELARERAALARPAAAGVTTGPAPA